jgi:prolyl-tRNA synthetase
MCEAYQRIFRRCGLTFRPVEADSGTIGGSFSHEFLVMADSGEDAMAYCSSCGYAANLEKAEQARPSAETLEEGAFLPVEEVATPDSRTIEEVCSFLGVQAKDVIKTLIFMADGKPVAILVRGDEEVNEIKVRNFLRCDVLEMALDDEIKAVARSPRGFVGPAGIDCPVLADYSLLNRMNLVAGANREGYHIRNVNLSRDAKEIEYADLRLVREGDLCPRCQGEIRFARGIEVGHVFKLGTKYSKAMKALYLDRNGKEQYMVMGCYGIGIGRTVAACIEQRHDENGIVWPPALAPYQAIVTPVNVGDGALAEAAEALYKALTERGVDTVLDDRDERAGVKFKDADLIGIPLRITIGPKRLAEGNVEIRRRSDGKTSIVALVDAAAFVLEALQQRED